MSKLETFSTATPNPLGIYLDHHSTTPVDPRVANAVLRAMVEEFGNANSVDHAYGEIARSKVNNAKECLADLVNCDPTDIHFTSGSTEAILLAISHAIGIASKLPLKSLFRASSTLPYWTLPDALSNLAWQSSPGSP